MSNCSTYVDVEMAVCRQ